MKRVQVLRFASTIASLLSSPPPTSQSLFVSSVTDFLNSISIPWEALPAQPNLLRIECPCPFVLHIAPSPIRLDTPLDPNMFKDMTDNYMKNKSLDLVHLHHDAWLSRRPIVLSRLGVKCGVRSRSIFARSTMVRRIPADIARAFLQEHHLWGATKAKFSYALVCSGDNISQHNASKFRYNKEEIVAVASFSNRHTIVRADVPCQSHELLRFCTQQNVTVVGGLSKLVRHFIRVHEPDDIVTQIDRDWGGGAGWCRLGFTSVSVMPPLVMAIADSDGRRRHLVGAGIQSPTNQPAADADDNRKSLLRLGLPQDVLDEVSTLGSAAPLKVLECLKRHGYSSVYDSGVERLCLLVPTSEAAKTLKLKFGVPDTMDDELIRRIWEDSVPKYPSKYYSSNPGIQVLLDYARVGGHEPVSEQ